MIIQKYIFKEIFKVQLVTFSVLLSVFLCQSIIRYVGRAATGETPSDVVFSMVLYSVPSICYLMLPLSLFVAIISAVGRVCSDSEMVVMRSSGFSEYAVLKIALILAVLTSIAAACNSLYLMPEAARAQQSLKLAAQNNPRYLPIESGRFVNFQSGDNRYVIYIEKVEGRSARNEREMGNLYVMSNTFSNDSSFTASVSGHVSSDAEGYQWLNLGKGNRYERDSAHNAYRSISFGSFKLPVGFDNTSEDDNSEVSMLSTRTLMNSDDAQYSLELQWRMAPIFAVIILTMIAVPLSMVNPRQGRFSRLWQAILIYASYYLLLLAFRNMINAGRMWVTPGLYLVPVIFFIVAAIPLNMHDKWHRRTSSKA